MKYLKRAIERVVSTKAGKVTLVTGARQVGKSTLLKHLYPKFRYVTLDDGFLLRQAEENPPTFSNRSASRPSSTKSSGLRRSSGKSRSSATHPRKKESSSCQDPNNTS